MRQSFGKIEATAQHLIPTMVVVPYRVIVERYLHNGELPHSSEPNVVVPVNCIPASSKVVFLSHTRLEETNNDNSHNIKLKALKEVMENVAKENQIPKTHTYCWIDMACIDQGVWAMYSDIGE